MELWSFLEIRNWWYSHDNYTSQCFIVWFKNFKDRSCSFRANAYWLFGNCRFAVHWWVFEVIVDRLISISAVLQIWNWLYFHSRSLCQCSLDGHQVLRNCSCSLFSTVDTWLSVSILFWIFFFSNHSFVSMTRLTGFWLSWCLRRLGPEPRSFCYLISLGSSTQWPNWLLIGSST